MIKVKIICGDAIDLDGLHSWEKFILSKEKYSWNWRKFFINSFQVERVPGNVSDIMDGKEYWALPCGNGKICLFREVREYEQAIWSIENNMTA